MIKTVLAPNAPWPAREVPKPKQKAKPKAKRATPKQIDAKFNEWLNTIKVVKC